MIPTVETAIQHYRAMCDEYVRLRTLRQGFSSSMNHEMQLEPGRAARDEDLDRLSSMCADEEVAWGKAEEALDAIAEALGADLRSAVDSPFGAVANEHRVRLASRLLEISMRPVRCQLVEKIGTGDDGFSPDTGE